ncbi:D-amino acid aminotransferase [Thalassotalea sp. PP2-459]|uniref:D-amino acid aminotransferase n=1 Tax=Thalassotalea sp. PP2-459 TaxID=1742724 RepID=UPI00094503DB|nr:D-amino acid aminotransferase [Thalassotalea sp. PP2-459]OKY25172.1 D-alanine aminotransferase [Thalassotalea sp. PP2-459]
MNTVYLNNQFIPSNEAKISPMDRGFLFGEGIYEVIPCYEGKFIGLQPHLDRLYNGLKSLGIPSPFSNDKWTELCQKLVTLNNEANVAVYIHVTRGSSPIRNHAYPKDTIPTVFAFTFEIPTQPVPDKHSATAYKVSSQQDLRWKRCQIKSTSLLGNVMHFQHGINEGNKETILFNELDQLTEASSSNVFIVKHNIIMTPPLDNQILPGVTRHILLAILKEHSKFTIEERAISYKEVLNADEVWLTSSTKEIAPVVKIDNDMISSGEIGDIWLEAQRLFSQYKYQY